MTSLSLNDQLVLLGAVIQNLRAELREVRAAKIECEDLQLDFNSLESDVGSLLCMLTRRGEATRFRLSKLIEKDQTPKA